jgi:hypothetical protein
MSHNIVLSSVCRTCAYKMVCTKGVTSERCILTQGGGSQDVPQQLCMGVVSNWKVLQPRGPVPDPEDFTEGLSDRRRTGASK